MALHEDALRAAYEAYHRAVLGAKEGPLPWSLHNNAKRGVAAAIEAYEAARNSINYCAEPFRVPGGVGATPASGVDTVVGDFDFPPRGKGSISFSSALYADDNPSYFFWGVRGNDLELRHATAYRKPSVDGSMVCDVTFGPAGMKWSKWRRCVPGPERTLDEQG